ncbi:class 1 isoprenoid biosynthesis enzyme [Labilibaculum sp.]|uniref:class 1 isoprenoid biosynthesis enzyme n=1 Tax=Labilibaculum sp. TaxID=2060723 RepID=UPI002AA87CC8|nr:class 1 isoprenoid biosynthesis enzyme [Labilibaculum sp.]
MTANLSILYKIQDQFIATWENCPEHFPATGKRFSYLEKRIWESKFDRFIKFVQNEANYKHPNKIEILQKSKLFFKDALAYSPDQLELIFSDEMLHSTKDFIQKAWLFDPDLGNAEIFQALRNVWIMLGLQSFFGKEIKITPSLLAYSLLYPYTDNLIDDASINKEEKINFCRRFALRLKGESVKSESSSEQQIYDLVEMIESEFDRENYPEVHHSLLAIHDAQTQSLALVSNKPLLSEEETFRICINKGARSVIADGYLVLGKLDKKQLHFLYEYGAYLQILDDLQDARQDYLDGVMTCFSRKLPYGNLDKLLCKTYFLGKTFQQRVTNLYPDEVSFQGLIQKSFALLFLVSIFENQEDFSDDFILKIEKHAPFRFSFLRKLKTDLEPFRDLMLLKIDEYRLSGCKA